MSKRLTCITMVLGLILASRPLAADTLHVAADAYTNLGSPGQNNGGAPSLFVRNVGAGGVRRAFVRFDLAPIPPGPPLSRATLRLWVADLDNTGSLEVRLIAAAWPEAGITAATEPALGPTVATRAIGSSDVQTYVTIDVTSVVNDWLSGATPNHGVALVASVADDIRLSLDSKENAGTSHPSEIETASAADITSVTAGTGLTGGGASGDLALSLRTDCLAGRILKWNGTNWFCAVDQVGSGTVTNVDTGTGLTGGPITTSGTVSLDTTFTDGRYVRRSGASLNVQCGGSPPPGWFSSITDALGAAEGYAGSVTITVVGMCEEQVRFRRSRTSLVGATPSDGIRRPPEARAALWVDGVQRSGIDRMTLDGNGGGIAMYVLNGTRIEELFELTIQNAQTGLLVEEGSSLCLIDSVIRNNLGDGAAGSHLCLGNTPVTGNGGNGVSVGGPHGGFANLVTTIEGNGGAGVAVSGGSASIGGTVRNNGGGGVSCGSRSSVTIGGRIADHPGAEGITATGGCQVEVSGTVENNRTGIHVSLGSLLSLSNNALIQGNSQDGVVLRDTSLITPWNIPAGSMPRVINNTGFGLRCDPPPAVAQVAFQGPTRTIEVQGNTQGQNNCPMNCQGSDCPIVP